MQGNYIMENNLERFIESISIDNKLINKADEALLKESLTDLPQKLKESVGDSPQGWWVPISKFTKNGNGRIYNRRLWENVLREQRGTWKGSAMLCNHPEDDGSPKDICGVWTDMKIGDDMVYGLLIPSGRLGEDLKEHLKNGLRIGTSSSGFGRLLSDGSTVDPDSFQIERLSDWVLNPSQGTFFSYDENSEENNHIINTSTGLRESNNNSSSLEEAKNNNNKEIFVKDSAKIAKLEEKKFRRDMESFLEEADAIKDPQERLQEFREIKSYLEDGACPDLREKIEEKIAAEEEYIKSAIQQKAEFKEKFDVDNTRDLEVKLTKIVEESASLNKEANDWKAVAEKLQDRLNEAYQATEERPTQAYVEYLKNKINSLESELSNQKNKFYAFAEKAVKESKGLKESKEKLENNIKNINEEKNNIFSQLTEAQKNLAAANALSEKMREEKEEAAKNLSILVNNYNNLKTLNENTSKSFESEKSSLKENIKNLNSDADRLNEQISDMQKDIEALRSIVESQRSKIEEATQKNTEYAGIISKQKLQLQEMAKETRDAQFKLYGEKTSKREVTRNLSPIVEYYESLYKTYGNLVVPFKEKLIGAPTIAEAKNIFYRQVLPTMNESIEVEKARLPESLSLTPEERADKLGLNKEKNYIGNILERRGWL